MKTCSVWSKRRDQYQSDNRETNNKTKPFKHKVFKQNWPNIIFFKHILLPSLWWLLLLCPDQSAVYTFCIQAMYTDPGPQEISSLYRYRGTYYVQQKKQYNQTINP